MYTSAIRRAALRAIVSQPASFASSQRTFVTRNIAVQATRRQWTPTSFRRTYVTGDKASPTDATTEGETVPPETQTTPAEEASQSPTENQSPYETVQTEPTLEEQKDELREESIATPESADAANPEDIRSKRQTTTQSFKEKAQQAATTVTDTAVDLRQKATSSGRREYEQNTNPPSKILYVGNLFFEVKAEHLEKEFSQYGNVVNSKIATDANGLSKGFGYVEFDDIESASEAVRQLDQTVLEGRRMAVQYHLRRTRAVRGPNPTTNPPSKTLFIGNMSFQMSDKDLNDLFRDIRNVLDVRVAIDRRTGQPRGFAHADFTDTASAEKAKGVLEAKSTYGRQLRVDFSKASTMVRRDQEPRDRDD